MMLKRIRSIPTTKTYKTPMKATPSLCELILSLQKLTNICTHPARTDEAVRRLMDAFKVDGLTRALTRQL